MLAVKSGNVEIKHGDSEVGQIKLEKWVWKRAGVYARGWGQQRNTMRGEVEHKDNFFSLLKTVFFVVFLLHWTQYFVAGVKGKMRGRGEERERNEKKGGDS